MSGNYPDGVNQQVFGEASDADDYSRCIGCNTKIPCRESHCLSCAAIQPDDSWADCPYCAGGSGHHEQGCEYEQ